jgi:hypothetical protein
MKNIDMADLWISGPCGIVRKADIVSIEKIKVGSSFDYNIVAFANNRQIILYSSIGEKASVNAMEKIMTQLTHVEEPIPKKAAKSDSSDDEKDVPHVSKSKKKTCS